MPLAPGVGLEPTTYRLTAECSTIELPWNSKLTIIIPSWQTWNFDDIKKYGLKRIGGCFTLDGAGFEFTMANSFGYKERPHQRGFLIHTDYDLDFILIVKH